MQFASAEDVSGAVADLNDDDGDDLVYSGLMELLNVADDLDGIFLENGDETDPLVQKDFNLVSYINTLFPSEQSLAKIDEVIYGVKRQLRSLDHDIRSEIRRQSVAGLDARKALDTAKLSIQELFQKIREIKDRAEKSEQMVREITRDIRQLDFAKKNLSASITTLNHLHMMFTGVESIELLLQKREYGEIASVLQGVVHVQEHFEKYSNIPQIQQLHGRVSRIQDTLGKQILDDFKQNFSLTTGKSPDPMLIQACRAVEVLDPTVRDELLAWFTKLVLLDYQAAFTENVEDAWLDRIDRRYAWLKRLLLRFESDFQPLFPASWNVDNRLCMEFCALTKRDLHKIMTTRSQELDVKLLVHAIQRTTLTESLLSKRFQYLYSSTEAASGRTPFNGMISKCFEPHLHIFIDSQDRALADLIDKFLSDWKTSGVPEVNEECDSCVLPSAAELFVFYKKCLTNCLQLSTRTPLLDLAGLFQKYLKEYCSKVLQLNLPKVSSSTLTSLLKDSETRFGTEELKQICCILSTAEYCQDTVQQLQEKLREKIDPEFADSINLGPEQDMFTSVITNSMQLLVNDMEVACDGPLAAMLKVPWHNVETVGDQSHYITLLGAQLCKSMPTIREYLQVSRKYLTQFCIKFANSFIPRFINNIFKCKSMSTIGAEQMLLDTHSLKTMLLDLPSIGLQANKKAPSSYTKIIKKGMARAEMTLKVVMSHYVDATSFLDTYINLLADFDLSNFQKVLDLKGMKKAEQQTLIDLFKNRQPSQLMSESALGSTQYSDSSEQDFSRIKRLEKLIRKQIL